MKHKVYIYESKLDFSEYGGNTLDIIVRCEGYSMGVSIKKECPLNKIKQYDYLMRQELNRGLREGV